MTQIYVGIGSNVEPEPNIAFALSALRDAFGPLQISPAYESAALGGGNDYVNLVVGCDSPASADAIVDTLKQIEAQAGRRRGTPECALDLDLLIHGEAVVTTGTCTLPRDDILEHAFVLRPLADLAPDGRHPVNGRTYRELWDAMAPHASELAFVRLDGDDD